MSTYSLEMKYKLNDFSDRTSEMALDVLDLLDYLQWTKDRSVNVVGISMGGMISLELAKVAPERFCSMTLISTTSGRGKLEKPLTVSLPPVSYTIVSEW